MKSKIQQIVLRNFGRRLGLTLVEVVVTVAVLGIILAVAMPSMADLLEKRRVIAASSEISSVLAYARTQVATSASDIVVRFDPDPTGTLSCVQVATYATNASGCKCWHPISQNCVFRGLNGGKMLRTFVVQRSTGVTFGPAVEDESDTSMNNVSFEKDQVGVTVDGGLKIKVEGRRGTRLRVEMNRAGLIRVCAPYNDVTGYGPC